MTYDSIERNGLTERMAEMIQARKNKPEMNSENNENAILLNEESDPDTIAPTPSNK